MKAILTDIQTGKFVVTSCRKTPGRPSEGTRRLNDEHQIEETGEKLQQ